MSYTQAAVLAVVGTVVLDMLVLRTRLLTRQAFWTAYAIVLFFQLVTNGILTGRRIVTYAPGAILGDATPQLLGDGRIAYAPVEDLLFGFALVVQTLAWWVFWGRSLRSRPALRSGSAGRRSRSRSSAPPAQAPTGR